MKKKDVELKKSTTSTNDNNDHNDNISQHNISSNDQEEIGAELILSNFNII